jgi:hypothetical protein
VIGLADIRNPIGAEDIDPQALLSSGARGLLIRQPVVGRDL